ncbi:MAG: hypothetical protein ACI92E_000503 [Oceanicoccus sp.]|jgi:hypothetical protein
MLDRIKTILATIHQYFLVWLSMLMGLTIAYYAMLMLSLLVRFQNIPNYTRTYDWLFNVRRILESTPSISDSLAIISDEWIFEVGYMNYDFGNGISEWSLFLAPAKILGIMSLAALVSTNILLLRKRQRKCSVATARSSGIATGIGAGFVALSSITMSWVVCCSTPTWVVGLAMMGLGVSTSLWLEPMGLWVNLTGFAILLVSCCAAVGKFQIDERNTVAGNS